MKKKINGSCKRIFAFSHIGTARSNHEDNYLLGKDRHLIPEQVNAMSENREIITDSSFLTGDFCVAISDGMGGYECGEVASLMIVEYLSAHYETLIKATIADADLAKFIANLNRHICVEIETNAEHKNMGATLCGVVCCDGHFKSFNVGDSRLYQYSSGQLRQISIDNTEGQRLLDLGLLNQEEIKTFPNRKAIYKYIGKDIELIPDIYELNNTDEGTLLLLCSDGLSDSLSANEIQELLSKEFIKIEDKGRFLVDMAIENKPDTGDNITLIIIEI